MTTPMTDEQSLLSAALRRANRGWRGIGENVGGRQGRRKCIKADALLFVAEIDRLRAENRWLRGQCKNKQNEIDSRRGWKQV